jgi:hypothetical protein
MTQPFQTPSGHSQSQTQSQTGPKDDRNRNLPGETPRRPADEHARRTPDPDEDIERGSGPERQKQDEPYTTF